MSEALQEVPSMEYDGYGHSSETIFVDMFQDKGNLVFIEKYICFLQCVVAEN